MNLLINFLEVACTNIAQETFYNTKQEQTEQLLKLHTQLLLSDRPYYRLMPFFPINDRSKTLILRGLLSTGKARIVQDEALEWKIIKSIVSEIPISRLLRFFVEEIASKNEVFGTKSLNNARVRRLGQYLWHRANAYQVIKYHQKYKIIIRHCRLNPHACQSEEKKELQKWLFGKLKKPKKVKYCELLRHRLLANSGNFSSLMKLPLDVAEGIALSRFQMSSEAFAKAYAQQGKATRKEVLRTGAKNNDSMGINFGNYDLLELIRYAQTHQQDWSEIYPHIQRKASRLAINLSLPKKLALVIDNSFSMKGTKEREKYPMAFVEAITRICLATDSEIQLWFTQKTNPELCPFKTGGATDLRIPLTEAIISQPDAILILSDGYENQSAGSIAQILNTTAVKQSGITFFQINPVAATEAKAATHSLSSEIKLIPIADIKQFPLAALINHAKLNISCLTDYLNKIETAIKLGDFKTAKALGKFQGIVTEEKQLQLTGVT